MAHFRRGHPNIWQFVVSYAPDWIITTILWWILTTITHHVSGFKRQFSLTDPSLQYPHAAHQRVSSRALWLVSSALPLGVQVIFNALFIRCWWDLHHSALGLWLSITLTGSITQIVKVTVGRPRPDLLSRCQPLPGSEDPPLGMSTVAVCTQTAKHILEDGWRSFPSGHSSLAFSGLGFLAFYLAGKLHLFDSRGHAGKVWLLLLPLGIAAWIAITRTMDYRHHWQDALTGSMLGLGVAYASYRQYYPPLTSKIAHIPFRTRFKQVGEEYDLGSGEVVDDDDEVVGLIDGSRKPQTVPEQEA